MEKQLILKKISKYRYRGKNGKKKIYEYEWEEKE